MSGTKAGSLKAVQTLKETYGEDYFANLGRKGGKAHVSKGFGRNRDLVSIAGRKGGKISKRGKAKDE